MDINVSRSFASSSQENIEINEIEKIVIKAFGKAAIINSIETTKYGDINSCYVISISNPNKKLFLKVENDKIIPNFYSGQIERENASIQLMQKHGIPCPTIYSCDTTKTEISKKYILTQFADDPLVFDIWGELTPDEKNAAKDAIITLIDKLEDIKSPYYGDVYLGGNKGKFANYNDAIKNLADILINDCINFGLIQVNESSLINAAVEKLHAKITNNFEPCFIHMDIHSRNLIGKKTGNGIEITAVLDFGNAMFGIPTTDVYRANGYKIFKEDPAYITSPKNNFTLNKDELFARELLFNLECLVFEGMMNKSYGTKEKLLTSCEAYLL